MYSFQPLVDECANTHYGFFAWCIIAALAIWQVLLHWNSRDLSWLSTIGLLCSILGFSLLVFTNSYAPEKQYENEKVTGTFVSFQPEGYNEKTGKTRADKHYMYVVYDVKGQLVILNAKAGVDYPKNVVLYKN